MRRLSLATKLFVAALPLVMAVGLLIALSVGNDLDNISEAERGATLGSVWQPLVTAINSVENELLSSTIGTDELDPARQATDQSLTDLQTSIEQIEGSDAMQLRIGAIRTELGAARLQVDGVAVGQPLDSPTLFAQAERELIGIGGLLPAEAGDPELGRRLLAVSALATAEQASNQLVANTELWGSSRSRQRLLEAQLLGATINDSLEEFSAIAPDQWQDTFREQRFSRRIKEQLRELDQLVVDSDTLISLDFDATEMNATIADIGAFRDELADQIVTDAQQSAASIRNEVLVRSTIAFAAVIAAIGLAALLARSITRRVRAVADNAHLVATTQLPALVEALRDPRAQGALPEILPIFDPGHDEIGELAAAFNQVQATLIDVANQQVEVLRRGVSDIFVTMARRNRSLIDRQLSLLDKFESDVDDHTVLGNYYQLDHLATRMRRNSESLLVLANAEARRRRVGATDIDDVVRASIGEVEDYRRIDVSELETLRVRGSVVADVSHLLAELLDNATSFSPPESKVIIGGRHSGEASAYYRIRIRDSGVGIAAARLSELNDLLENPPVVGLSVEPTLGMSVVSLLANKHGIAVKLIPGNPGLTVDVMLPEAICESLPATVSNAPSSPAPPVDRRVSGPIDRRRHVDEEDRRVRADAGHSVPDVVEPAHIPKPMRAPEHAPAFQVDQPPAFETHPAASAPAATEPTDLFPPPAPTPSGEFDRLPAPPRFGTTATRPVTPDDALPVPPVREPAAPATATNSTGLPVRTRGIGPQDGPDRLAGSTTSNAGAPSALQAALAAFDAGTSSGHAASQTDPPASLPVRQRSDAVDDYADEAPTSRAPLDPNALRQRLRSFQSEFRTGSDASNTTPETATTGRSGPGHDDLGGER